MNHDHGECFNDFSKCIDFVCSFVTKLKGHQGHGAIVGLVSVCHVCVCVCKVKYNFDYFFKRSMTDVYLICTHTAVVTVLPISKFSTIAMMLSVIFNVLDLGKV